MALLVASLSKGIKYITALLSRLIAVVKVWRITSRGGKEKIGCFFGISRVNCMLVLCQQCAASWCVNDSCWLRICLFTSYHRYRSFHLSRQTACLCSPGPETRGEHAMRSGGGNGRKKREAEEKSTWVKMRNRRGAHCPESVVWCSGPGFHWK